MRYVRLCLISLIAALPLAVFASPQPLEQIKISESQLAGRVAMLKWIWPAAARWPPARQ